MVDEELREARDQIRSWSERFEKLHVRQSEQIDALTKDVSALTADVRSLMRNQEALFNKTSRPFQWGAFVSALGLVAVGAGLLITPIHRELSDTRVALAGMSTEFHEYRKDSMEHRIVDAGDVARIAADVSWLKRLEERQNARLHAGLMREAQEHHSESDDLGD